MPDVTLPDGSRRHFDAPVSVAQVAADIGPGLAKAAVGGRVDGRLVDTDFVVDHDAEVAIVTPKDEAGLEMVRHSTAHLMAQAVKQLYPEAQVTIGPVIEDGFYYDFSREEPFTPEDLERIEALLTPRTRVLQVSHVTAPTGIRLPVREMARLAQDHDLWFHIDGAQSAGMFPVNLREIGCDSYGTSGHKWMGAPHGTGVLYVREDRLDEVAPTEVGAYSDDSYELPDTFTYNPTAQRYEPGTRDAATVVGLVEAIAFLEEIGMHRVAQYGQGLARYLQDALRGLPGVTVLTPDDPQLAGSITTFKTDKVPYDALYRYLAEEDLRCRIVTERGIDAVRVSTHIFNAKEDCDRVIAATRAALDA